MKTVIVLLSSADSVELAPEAKLDNWLIQELQRPNEVTYHFIGFINGRGRISTPIAEWHSQSRIGRTASGRVYELIGPPGDMTDMELRALCAACKIRYGATSISDVTSGFIDKRH